MALLDEIGARLISAGVGVSGSTGSWSVFKSREPPLPDAVITLFETGGLQNQARDDMLDLPSFQVRVRGAITGYATARTKIAAARTALEGMTAGTFSGRYYCQVTAQAEPQSLGYDDSNRPILIMNFVAMRSKT